MRYYCHIENGGHNISAVDPKDNKFGEYPALVYETNHYGNPSPAVVIPVLTVEQADAMIACLKHLKKTHLDKNDPEKFTYEFNKPELNPEY
jgi:hypothetical protein